jgi:hypothetical protein
MTSDSRLDEHVPPPSVYVWRVFSNGRWIDASTANAVVSWVENRSIHVDDVLWDPQQRCWTKVGHAPEIKTRLTSHTSGRTGPVLFVLSSVVKTGCSIAAALLAFFLLVKLIRFFWYL